MRAAVEGAAAAAAAAASASSHPTPSVFSGERAPTALRVGTILRGDGSSESRARRGKSATRAAALAQFTADVMSACETTPPPSPLVPLPRPPPFMPPAAVAAPGPPVVSAPEQGAADETVVPQRGETTATTTPTRHPQAAVVASMNIAFDCLSHRQATVRDAAVGLLHAQALALGPRAALALYRRTVRKLEQEQENETSEKGGVKTAGVRCGQGTNTQCCPTETVPEGDAADTATLGAGRSAGGGPARIKMEKTGTWAFRAETRRRRDRIGGLLVFLEKMVCRGDVLPYGAVGNTCESLFSVLRQVFFFCKNRTLVDGGVPGSSFRSSGAGFP